jgi:Helix-turn-helix domain
MSSLRATRQRQIIVSERIQSNQAMAILGVPLRSVQNLAAGGVLPSAAKYVSGWTFDEKALRRYVAEREQATRDKAKVRIKAAPSKKKPVDRAPSYGSQAAYERARGIKPGQPRRKERRQIQPTSTKPPKDSD